MPTTYVYAFQDGGRDMAALLGGKGANLAEMTRIGLPVPPGFVLTTEACRHYLATGREPDGLHKEVTAALEALEKETGRRLGRADDPLLLSVRSGGKISMPGMMETVLNVGLNDASVRGLAKTSGREHFAWDSYRRLIQMFGHTVMGVAADVFEEALASLRTARGVRDDSQLGAEDLAGLVGVYKKLIREATGEDFPQDPAEQLRRAVRAVFTSWNGERARLYRKRQRISDSLGTAVTVQAMVFGNFGPDSGSGVAFTRDPATGAPGLYGDYLSDAQGEDVVAGVRNTMPLRELSRHDPDSYARLQRCAEQLEAHYRDLCDIEFTIERGTLWMLQTRIGARTAEAAFTIAYDLLDENRIDEAEALGRVTGAQLGRLMFPAFDTADAGAPLARGVPASPGAAFGAVVFDPSEAAVRAASGEAVVLVRHETTPEDLPGMVAARAVLTSRGGKTSHAAVVARGMGKVCVCGAEDLRIDVEERRLTAPDGTVVEEGTVLSVDGSSGAVYLGALPLTDSPVLHHLDTGERPTRVATAVDRALRHADSLRRLEVRANADTPEDAARARRLGARGIGLCRTEHMFLGDRRPLVERMILATDESARREALAALLPLQREDFTRILAEMDGLPVTVRLLDPPLHEFLPDRTGLSVRVASARATGAEPAPEDVRLLAALDRMHESNPMLGLRGVRLGLLVPGLVATQVRALGEAIAERLASGGDPRAEIMVPLVAVDEELRRTREEIEHVLAEVSEDTGTPLHCPVGTMIELPRAALTAGSVAESADFFSFGTNDLTQTVWGLSRDDAEAGILPAYLDGGVLASSPFETLDEQGVGRLVALALQEGRERRPGLEAGVCGEHGGDPESVHFFHRAGLDYVSCSPYRVPVARLEAGRAAIPDRVDAAERR
ncbi:pyruvate, phosphate dikinase [Streptomyces sp. NPDC054796]